MKVPPAGLPGPPQGLPGPPQGQPPPPRSPAPTTSQAEGSLNTPKKNI